MNQIKQQLLLTVVLLLCSIGIANATIYTGSCGDNVNYTLDTATGEMKITGTGEMTNWNRYISIYAPWYSNRSYIKSVSISNGVTSIGEDAFYDCSVLASVTIPNSMTSIATTSFWLCPKLYEVYNLSNLNIQKGSTGYGDVGFYAKVIHTSLNEPSIYQAVGEFLFFDLETPQLYEYTGNATDIIFPRDFKGKIMKLVIMLSMVAPILLL